MTVAGRLRRALFGISPAETEFRSRGFLDTGEARQRLEAVGAVFVRGYNAALDDPYSGRLRPALDAFPPADRGFAYEGAAMALALLDRFAPHRASRWRAFLDGPAAGQVHVAFVGYGWALARTPWIRRPEQHVPAAADPLLCWLALDGYGFHQGYFDSARYVGARALPRGLSSGAREVFDQGLGRSLWFVFGADVHRIASAISSFAPERQSSLWSGAGLACAYAGGVQAEEIALLGGLAGMHSHALAQGVAFAAKARERAGNPTDFTELACRILCGMGAPSAAAITDAALPDRATGGLEAYEGWRKRIQQQLVPSGVIR